VSLVPNTAVLVSDVNGISSESDIDIDLIQLGDKLRVMPGSKLPCDGKIIHGSTIIDESMITGEAMPVSKSCGDAVYGGTINHNGSVIMVANRVGGDTALAQIIKLVENAQTTKAPIQTFADHIASVFAPFVVSLSFLTFFVWLILVETGHVPQQWIDEFAAGDSFLFALKFAISTVVVACPCALGLATPTAIMVGTGVGAQLGVLIKGGAALEMAHNVTSVLFDKTGTLTEGKPSVRSFVNLGNRWTDHEVLSLTASCEKASEHPLARAVVQKAESENLIFKEFSDFNNVPGKGLECRIGSNTILVGSKRWMSHNCVELSERALMESKAMETRAETIIAVAIDGKLEGFFGVTDTVKEGVARTIIALNALGIKTWMVTGDNQNTANAVARDIGMFNVIADVLPSEKSLKVEELQAQGEVVAFVGDGVNDSVALAKADVGIAIGSGAEIAIEAADMVLIKNDVADVYTALELSRLVFNRIKYNFMWAMGYNVLALPMAAGVFFPIWHAALPPQLAGLLMAFSSVSVVLSSLSLKMYKKPNLSLASIKINKKYQAISTISDLVSPALSKLKSRVKNSRRNASFSSRNESFSDGDGTESIPLMNLKANDDEEFGLESGLFSQPKQKSSQKASPSFLSHL
jgi:Cu+-exporting ATPase